MKRSKLINLLSCLFCAVYVVALPTAQALVLCIDEHNHGEVQSAYDNCCLSPQVGRVLSGLAVESFRQLSESQCDNCDNIALDQMLEAAVPRTDLALNINPPPTPVIPYYSITNPQHNCIKNYTPQKVPISNFPSFLRNTILLL